MKPIRATPLLVQLEIHLALGNDSIARMAAVTIQRLPETREKLVRLTAAHA